MRTRMSTEQRREQLLSIGAKLFAGRPYDEVWIEEVAEIAGVSRGLLYHYFKTKREFFAEVSRAERDRLLRMSAPDPQASPLEQLATGLDVYIDYARSNPDGYRIVHRASADQEIRQVREEGFALQAERIEAALRELIEVTPAVRLAIKGWLAFTSETILAWLDDPVITQPELRDLCARTAFAAVGLER